MKKTDKEAQDKLKWFLDIFDCDEAHHLPDKVLEKVLDGDTQIYENYIKEYPDLSQDSLRILFETYFSDRKILKQDFTPDSIAELLTNIAVTGIDNPPEMLDECAGIGCLIIPYWKKNPNVFVWAREKSAGTIPFLLFNLALRNMHGIIIQGDTLTLETSKLYQLKKGEQFSKVSEFDYKNALEHTDPILLLKAMLRYNPERFMNEQPNNQSDTSQVGFFR